MLFLETNSILVRMQSICDVQMLAFRIYLVLNRNYNVAR